MADISSITLLDGVTYYFKDAYAREHSGDVTAETDTVGSASAGTDIIATEITAWDAGSAPTLGTAIPADDITAWTSNTPTSASVTNGVLTISTGTAANLAYTAKSIPNVTSAGSAPSLTKTNKTIPNISVTNKTVVTNIVGASESEYDNGDEVSY